MLVIATLLGGSTAFAQPTVETREVGRAALRTEAYLVSPHGVHYAVLTPKGGRNVLVVDGVEGPEFDMFLSRRGRAGTVANDGIVFSADGSRHAYFAAVGNQYIFVVDDKETARGELGPSNLGYVDMQFSPGGKHVYFLDLKPGPDGRARAEVVVDGKAGPPAASQNIVPVFSPDDSRWAYNAQKYGGRPDEYVSVVDGREVSFVGFDPFFTGDNRLVASLPSKPGEPPGVAIDGKPAVNGVSVGRGKVAAAPTGARWAGIVPAKKPGDPPTLYLDGKQVPECQSPEEVVFSRDGKRYMAICASRSPLAKYVVMDGRKGPDYQAVDSKFMRFAADSSRAIYVGASQGKNFVVVDGQPSEGYLALLGTNDRFVMSERGGHYGYVGSNGGAQTLVVDGKIVALDSKSVMIDTLSFSADGARYAFVSPRPQQPMLQRALVIDGVEVRDITLPVEAAIAPNVRTPWWIATHGPQAKFYEFSPDGKHVAFDGTRASDPKPTLFVDGKAVATAAPGSGFFGFVSWSPDGKHLFWTGTEKTGTNTVSRVFADGKPADATFGANQPTGSIWEMGADGKLQLLVAEGQAIKRYRITPAAGTSIDTLLATAQ
jgi:Tol biopolymer transport system component